ncbi:MAG: hypothetical protein KGI37_10115, partial [Alphaproteobacteria bacterium]|nr:hypothetical protein [Alphaproteobacteria bacterium]
MAFSLRQLAYSGFTVAMMAYAGQAHASTGHNDVCIPGSMIGVSGQMPGTMLAACRTPEGYKLWDMDGKGRNAGTFGLRLDGQGRVISAYDVLPQGNAALHVHGAKMTMVLLPKEHMKNSGKMAAAFGNAVVDARQEAKSLYGAAFPPISYNVKIETIQPSPVVAKPVPPAAKPAVAVEQHKPVAAPVVPPVVSVVAQKPAIKPVAPAAVAPVAVPAEVNLGLGDNWAGAPASTAVNPFKGAALVKPITANPEDRIKLSTQSGISIADLIAAMGLTGLFAFAAGVATSRRVKDGLRAAKNKMVAGANAVKNGARHVATEVIAKNAVNGALHAYGAYANSKIAAASVVNKASSSVSAGVQTAKDNA